MMLATSKHLHIMFLSHIKKYVTEGETLLLIYLVTHFSKSDVIQGFPGVCPPPPLFCNDSTPGSSNLTDLTAHQPQPDF